MSKARSRATALAPLLAAPLLFGGCSGKPPSVPDPPPARARLVEIVATEFHLNPSRIIAEPGETLTLALRNEGTVDHSLAVDLGGGGVRRLDANVHPHETAKMSITVPMDLGNFAYYCPIDGHRAFGMEGTLTVAAPPVVRLSEVASGFTAPVAMIVPPDGSRRRFVVDQIGVVRVVDAGGALLPEPFLDVRDRMARLDPDYDERGLLGLAFHPGFAENGRLFVYYNAPLRAGAPAGFDNTVHVSEFHVSAASPDRADMASERVLLAIDHPQSNHEAGMLAFGPDKMLYISEGDGGGAGDIDPGHTPGLGNGQDVTKLLGKILRIDVDGAAPYAIPADNPFAGGGGAPEIFAYGFRNPYRFSFDSGGAHQLFVADVGQNLWEEVSIVEKGGNYGWNILEGTHCFDTRDFTSSLPTCASVGMSGEPLRWPVIEVPNAAQEDGVAVAIIGGDVYRGRMLPGLAGQYVFGAWTRTAGQPDGAIFAASPAAREGDLRAIQRVRVIGTTSGDVGRYVLAFGQDDGGELHVLTSDVAGPSGATGKLLVMMPPR